jgi:hypothetical protein
MCVVKSRWAPVQGELVVMRRVNGRRAIFRLVMMPISLYFG